MKTLEIKKGWFWSAGDKFCWRTRGHERAGVGIDMRLLVNNTNLCVVVGGTSYLLDCLEAIQFAREFSAYEVRNGIKLAVISKSLFKPFPEEVLRTTE